MNWTTKELGEICDESSGFIRTGPFGSQLHEADYSKVGTPVVMPKDIIEGKVVESNIARVSQNHVERLSQHQLNTGDIVYGRRGDIGRQALVTHKENGWLCGTGCLRIHLGHSHLDAKYLHYYLRDQTVIDGIAKMAIGATMPNLNTTILRSIPITYPTVEFQQRIASILSAYDDLIENNTRRIAILEEMARRIYDEWFVRFRFPGHENTKMVDSELGMIPEGWEVTKVKNIVNRLKSGNVFTNANVSKFGNVIVIDQSTDEYLGFHNNPPDHNASTQNPIIIFGDHTCKMQIMITPFSVGPNTVPFIAQNKTSIFYLYCLVNGLIETKEYKRHWTEFSDKIVVKAPPDLNLRFGQILTPIFEMIETLRKKNHNLRATRHLLLPKLISGELDVSNIPLP